MSNEILYVLLPDFAAHEIVYLAQAIASDEFALKENPKYVNRIVAPTPEPVGCCGMMFDNGLHTADKKPAEAEIGYRIGRPYRGTNRRSFQATVAVRRSAPGEMTGRDEAAASQLNDDRGTIHLYPRI